MRLFDLANVNLSELSNKDYRWILENNAREKGVPISAYFELTPLCTLNCPMCYVHLDETQIADKGQILTKEQWITLAQQANKLGVVNITLSGGEPFIRDDFFDIYDALYDMGISICIMTNGTLINDKVIKHLVLKPPEQICVTLYGFSCETYKKVCGNGDAYYKVISSIRKVIDAKLRVSLQTTTTPDNIDDIPKIKQFAHDLRINYRYFTCIGHFRECNEEMTMKNDILNEQFKREVKELVLAKENNNVIKYGFNCGAGKSAFAVNWHGEMQPCIVGDFIKSYPLTIGVIEAWKSVYEESSKIPQLIECQTCKYRNYCSNCIAVHFGDTSEFGKPSPRLCYKVQNDITD